MSSSKKPGPNAQIIKQALLYDELIAAIPGIERKGAALPYTSCNGHMFSFLSAEGIVAIRLPREEREQFIKKHNAALMQAHGTVMKEYVAVPASLLDGTEQLRHYLLISYEYVQSLKPKESKGRGS